MSDCDSGNHFSECESDGDEMYCDYSDEESFYDCDVDECKANTDDEDDYPFEVLGEEKIAAQMSDSVNEVKNVTLIPERRVKILLNYFKWDKLKLMERFYSEKQDDIFQDIVPIQADSSESVLECKICFDTFSKGDMAALDCGHFFCAPCWSGYLSFKIVQEGSIQMIECPDPKCHMVVDDQTLLNIVTPQIKVKYLKLIMDYYVQCNKLIKWCSAPDCNYAIKVSYLEPRSVKCKCGHSFCFSCSEDWHEPINCEMMKKWIKKTNDDSETCKWISLHTKDCPKCQMPIEKNGGCNHMVCRSSSCNFEFCWLCMEKWGKCGYQCNRFVEKEDLSLDETRKLLEKFVFYSDRYMNHLNSLKFDKELYDKADSKMKEMTDIYNMSFQEVQFLKTAVDILCKCRRTLLKTYVFGYYVRKNNQKDIFEDNQRDLETAIDTLSGYLEKDIESMADLKNMKKEILDKSTYVEQRRKVLVAHIYEGNDKDWWETTQD